MPWKRHKPRCQHCSVAIGISYLYLSYCRWFGILHFQTIWPQSPEPVSFRFSAVANDDVSRQSSKYRFLACLWISRHLMPWPRRWRSVQLLTCPRTTVVSAATEHEVALGFDAAWQCYTLFRDLWDWTIYLIFCQLAFLGLLFTVGVLY